MDFKELSTKNEVDLKTLLATTREKLRELRFKYSNKQLKNVREVRATKKLIANILTLLNKKK